MEVRLMKFRSHTTWEHYHTVDTIQNTQRVKRGMECDGSIFIMHESIPFECRSEELYLLRCTPSINAIQAQDTIPTGIVTLLAGYSDVFPPKLPDSLPPHRVFLLGLGITNAAIRRVTPEGFPTVNLTDSLCSR